jgi:hypothetical protein
VTEGSAANNYHAGLIWAIADLLRVDFRLNRRDIRDYLSPVRRSGSNELGESPLDTPITWGDPSRTIRFL